MSKKCANKKCTRYGIDLPLSDFSKRLRNPDGLETRCKRCVHVVTERNKHKCSRTERDNLQYESIFIGDSPKYYWLSD